RLRRGIRGQVPEGARVAHEGSGQAALFLRLPRGALEASEDHESNRERLCHRAAPAAGDQGSGVEKAGTRLRLQAAGHGGPAPAQARRRPAPPPGASGGEDQRPHHAGAARSRRAEGGRLITLDPQHLTIARGGPWRWFEDVEFATRKWVWWFNHHRLLEPIGYIPPVELEEAYYRRNANRPLLAAL